MKRTTRVIQIIGMFICFFGILFTACKKKEIQGPQGDPGTPGIGGNSNIASSIAFEVTSSQWVVDTVLLCRKATITFAVITKDIIEKGAVKVYTDRGNVWAELPLTVGDLFTQFGFDEGHLYLNYINIEGGMPPAPPTANYRVVILSEVSKPAPGMNDKNFEEVVKAPEKFN